MEMWLSDAQSKVPSSSQSPNGGDAPVYANLPPAYHLRTIQPKITFYKKRCDGVKQILNLDATSQEEHVKNDPRFARQLKRRNNRVILVTHSFGGNADWIYNLRNALLDVEKQVVAVVEWNVGQTEDTTGFLLLPIDYKQATANCLAVGEWLGQVATWLENAGARYLWGIGHGLGAHLMGMAGKVGKEKSRKTILFDRITGLDPAGPGFQTGLPGYRRLCPEDAGMVDVIHTDARHCSGGVLLPYFGTILPLGSIDFYYNYGFGTTSDSLRNRALAHELFIWSITNPGKLQTCQELVEDGLITPYPVGIEVNASLETRYRKGKAEMGYFADTVSHQSGNWHVPINSLTPFAPVPCQLSCLDFSSRRKPGQLPPFEIAFPEKWGIVSGSSTNLTESDPNVAERAIVSEKMLNLSKQ